MSREKVRGNELLFGKNGNDLEKYELKEIAGEGENNTEDDLNQCPLLFVLFVESPVEEPEPRPS